MTNLNKMGAEYHLTHLKKDEMHSDPCVQFDHWFNEAISEGVPEANAMTLATANKNAEPSARIVLLKYFDENGFVFFTNYDSKKGAELAENPQASLLFWWQPCHRQVRIEGRVEKLSDKHNDDYFHERKRESQLGALASPQSRVIESRENLLHHYSELEKQYEGKIIPRPSHWGGYVLHPTDYEFWQGGTFRLHDRFSYHKDLCGWVLRRLAP